MSDIDDDTFFFNDDDESEMFDQTNWLEQPYREKIRGRGLARRISARKVYDNMMEERRLRDYLNDDLELLQLEP